MPICPNCIVGMPEWYTECPSCGGDPVELARPAPVQEPQPEPVQEPEPEPEPALAVEPDPDPEPVAEPQPEPEPVAEPEPERASEEFVASDTSFAVRPPSERSPQPVARRAHPTRWVHRAYRGDVDVVSKSSNRSTILAVFGDGLLAVDAGGQALSRVVGLRGSKHRRIFAQAASSEDAHEQIGEARLYPLSQIESVYVEKGRGRALLVTIRMSGDANPQFLVAPGRHRDLIALLTPVLRSKLRDAARHKNAAKAR